MFTGIAENNLFHTNISFYSILRHCPSVSGETIPLYVPTRNAWKTQSLDILTSIWYCNYFPLVFVVQSLNLWTHGLKHARLPCPSPSPRVCSNSCPLSWWCHSAISSSVNPSPPVLNLSQHQGLFQWVNFTSGGQSIEASASVLPKNIQGSFPLGLAGLISLLAKGLSRLLQHDSSKASILQHSAFFMVYSSICTWLLEKP